jgi:eukaryotic-like serine/threonine-protein kinase
VPISPGTRLGPYELGAPIGSGGMGEVYTATDTRLNRTVAVKVLPERFASEPGRRERLEREAKAVSSLNHPHICTLHDVGQQGGTYFLVMELLEGQTLEARLAKGALPLDQALDYATQIANALEKAHRHGVVHRDLKPGNIMLTRSGVKLLDFGLAKVKGGTGATVTPSEMATVAGPLTVEGMIVGTLQYMAPEQLEGQEADVRTDIFAFGAVVYEMVTGKKAFVGESQASLIAAILERAPRPMQDLQPLAPKALDQIVARCLAKDRDERWQSASDLAPLLQWARDGSKDAPTGVSAQRRGGQVRVWQAATVGLLVVAAALVAALMRPRPQPPETRTDIMVPPSSNPNAFALSPDGTRIAYAAHDTDGMVRVMVRRLDSEASAIQRLKGTENPFSLVWSPDGRAIAFNAEGRLKTIDLETASVRQLASAPPRPLGGWDGDRIAFVNDEGGVSRVSVTGNAAPARLDDGSRAHLFSCGFLPSERLFVFDRDEQKAYAAESGGSPTLRAVVDADNCPVFLAPKTLLYVSQGTLYARSFDPERVQFGAAPPVVLATNVVTALGSVSVSDNGLIAYRTYPNTPTPRFSWVDRSGNRLGVAAEPRGIYAGSLELTANDEAVVFEQEAVGTSAIRLYAIDLRRPGALPTQLTSGTTVEAQPTLSPDGRFLAFFRGNFELYVKPFGGSEIPAKIVAHVVNSQPLDWSPDGRWLLYQTGGNIWAMTVTDGEPTGEPVRVASSDYVDSWGQFSPDGHWVAFESDRTGQHQIYVTPFPGAGNVMSITKNGGTQVRWNPRGGELFFISLDGQFSAVPIRLPGGADGSPDIDEPVSLFPAPIGSLDFRGQQYDVSADGRRFLMNTPRDANSAITLVQNWTPRN